MADSDSSSLPPSTPLAVAPPPLSSVCSSSLILTIFSLQKKTEPFVFFGHKLKIWTWNLCDCRQQRRIWPPLPARLRFALFWPNFEFRFSIHYRRSGNSYFFLYFISNFVHNVMFVIRNWMNPGLSCLAEFKGWRRWTWTLLYCFFSIFDPNLVTNVFVCLFCLGH